MVKINLFLDDENGGLYQWDIGQRLRVYGAQAGVRVDYVMGTQALSVDTYAEGGNVYANIPNILLQQSGSIRALVYVTGEGYGETVKEARFRVQEREKPSDYVYTETEVKSYDDLADRVAALEESPVSREDIAEAVESYLSENPVVTEETDPTVPEWAKQPQKPTYTAEEVGALPDTTEIPTTLPNPKPLRIYDGVNNIYRNYTGEDAVQIVIPKVPTDVSAFKNDAGYLTEHQSLDGYAQKTDIPDVLPNPEPLLIHNIDGSGTTVEYNGVEPVQIHAIPNPKALTFTGAVQGEYDGSEALTVNIPEGGGSGGTDLTLGMTGATVGQIAKITAVDDEGKPTAWEPVELSNGEVWEEICTIEFTEEDEVSAVDQDLYGEYRKLMLHINKDSADGLVTDSSSSEFILMLTQNKKIATSSTGTNKGLTTYTWRIEYFPDLGFVDGRLDNGLFDAGTYTANYIDKPISSLHIQTGGSSFFFKTFTMLIWGVRA